ncbi:ABC transporter permease [Saccharothrix longispora]|uniref:ABC transport system permease protein n=1 Tax=Saccharothrix longispora TaxID=33920 RepID=A0ABU1Q115_9PSEU|nr:ABC transporter permease [Saccharothrix longispora]MDR6596582.1 putative ABC transport system permease protein [Saccharothrix longispora]
MVFARSRFALMGSVVALTAILMVLLSGLSEGLVNDGVSGLKKLPVTSFAFERSVATDAAFSRSVVDLDAVDEWAGRPGVAEAAPFGNTLVNARTGGGVEIDLALFGVEPGSFVDPAPASGERLGSNPGEVVVSATAVDAGVRLGDVVTLDRIGTELTVVGVLDGQHTFGHVDIGYVPLRTWQEVRLGIGPGDQAPAGTYDEVTAVAVRSDGADLGAADAAAGTTSLTLGESFGASPGYTAETATLRMIQVFLYAISALVVGAFFTVLTIHRKPEIAVLRAMGASTWYVLRDSLAQSLVLLLVSTGLGVGLGVAAGAALATTPMPFALSPGPVALASLLLIALGMVGACVAVLRITKVDPLTALGGNR